MTRSVRSAVGVSAEAELFRIPANRPVIGIDLEGVQQQFRLLTADACWLFGLSITRWMQIVRRAPHAPVKDPSLALLVRFLNEHPELSVIPKFPGVAEMFEMLNSIQEIDQKRFSVLFGSEASATYRWLKPGSQQTPAVNRLMLYLRRALMMRQPEQRADMLEDFMKTVRIEGMARGVPDVLAAGTWNPQARSARKAAKAAAAAAAGAAAPVKARPAAKKVRPQAKAKSAAAAAPAAKKAPSRPRRVKATPA